MKILQYFKFKLKSHTADVTKLRQFAGACRFVWNKALEFEKKSFESSGKYLGYNKKDKVMSSKVCKLSYGVLGGGAYKPVIT